MDARPEALLREMDWLRALARRLVEDAATAEDVVQETVLAALRRPAEEGRPPRSWLRRVATNVVLQTRRGEANRRAREERAARREALPSAEELARRVEGQRLLAEAVAALPEPLRSTLVLCYSEGLAPAEIARRQGTPGGTVRRRLKEARERLRADLERRSGGEPGGWMGALVPLITAPPSAGAATGSAAALLGGLWTMKKLIAAVLVAAIGAGTWTMLRREAAEPELARAETPAPEALDLPAGGEADDPVAAEGTGLQDEARRPLPVGAETRGVSGAVNLAAGCGADESLEVFLLTEPMAYIDFAKRLDADELADELVARATVDTDGRFHLSLPPAAEGVEGGYLMLRGRHLYLERPLALEDDGAMWLDPEVGAWIGGRLTTPEGEPAAGESIYLVERGRNLDWSVSVLQSLFDTTVETDADGTYAFRALPVTTYQVMAVPSVLAPRWQDLAANAPCGTNVLDMPLSVGGGVRGRVFGPDGEPVADALVHGLVAGRLIGFDDVEVREVRTDTEGRFELDGLPVGEVLLRAWSRGTLDSAKAAVWIQADRTQGGVALELGDGRSIDGLVRYEDDTPAAGVPVIASFDRAFLAGDTAFHALRGVYSEAQTDGEGRFHLGGLGPGPFVVRVEDEEGRRARRDTVRPSEPGAVPSEPIELTLRPPLVLAGRVRSSTGPPPRAFRVFATRVVEGSIGPVGLQRVEARFEDDQGRFTLEGLDEGSWRVHVEADGFATHRPAGVELPHPEEAPLELVLDPSVSVTGRVLDPQGAPIAGAEVRLETGRSSWATPLSPHPHEPSALTDDDGRFVLEHLSPGPCSLYARHEEFAPGIPAAIEVGRGENDVVELRLPRGGTIEGVVYDEDGAPAGSRLVVVERTYASTPRFRSTTADGRFRFEHLEPATWSVVAVMLEDNPLGHLERVRTEDVAPYLFTTMVDVEDEAVVEVVLGGRGERPITVHGVVRAGGMPVADAFSVILPDQEPMAGMRIFTTDEDGRYSVELAQAGLYSVSVQRFPGSGNLESMVSLSREIPDVDRLRLDIELPAGRIAGRVRTADGEPAAHARITVASDGKTHTDEYNQGQYTEVNADEAGRFVVPGLSAGSYAVFAGGSSGDAAVPSYARVVQEVVLEPGGWVDDLEIELPPPAGATVHVVDTQGQPVAGVAVFARAAEGHPVEAISFQLTNSNGICRLDSLAAADYRFLARGRRLASPESPLFSVQPGRPSEVQLVVDDAVRLWVELVGDDEAPRGWFEVFDQAGNDVGSLFPLEQIESIFLEGGFSTRRQVFGPLPPGTYRIEATVWGGEAFTREVVLTGEEAEDVTLEIEV